MSYLNEKIKEARKNKRLTQKEVADYLGVSDRMYQRYEKDVEPSIDTIKKLNEFFGTDILSSNPFPADDPQNWEIADHIAVKRRLALLMSKFYELAGESRSYEQCLTDINDDRDMILADLRRSGKIE